MINTETKTIEELIVYGKSKVHSEHAKMLLANLLNKNSLELLTCLNETVSSEIIEKYKYQLSLLEKQLPVQYIIGKSNFYGNDFIVNENTLIPRFETEELVEKTLFYIDKFFPTKNLNIIDLGTGTGCIGITLKKMLPESKVTLVDISEETLKVTKENARLLSCDVDIINSDYFNEVSGTFDVVISNPPYIKEKEEIEALVKNNEPNLALYAGIDGLDSYRKILKNISNHLNKFYLIAFEIGCTQKSDIENLVKENLPDSKIITHKDLQGRDRMVFIYHM